MTEERLFLLLELAVGALVSIWFLIFFFLLHKRIRNKKFALIEETFADVVSNHLYGGSTHEHSFIQIQRIFRKIGITEKDPVNVQFLINLMIRTQRALLGKNHEKIQQLYTQIPPYKASFRKTEKKQWYLIARGIREMYEMDQKQYTQYVTKFRNHPNVFVRREAQIALVVFLGWESLRFLPYLKNELDLWQQIKIVEKLHDLYPTPKVQYLKEAYDIEHDYGRELVMRIIRKYNLKEEVDYIVYHLFFQSFEVRETAIYCLSSFELNPEQLENVQEAFLGLSDLQQQKQVLEIINNNSEEKDLSFFTDLWENASSYVKLSIAEILWNRGLTDEVYDLYYKQYPSEPKSLKA